MSNVVLPESFEFITKSGSGTLYTAKLSELGYGITWQDFGYNYEKEFVEDFVSNGIWIIQQQPAIIKTFKFNLDADGVKYGTDSPDDALRLIELATSLCNVLKAMEPFKV